MATTSKGADLYFSTAALTGERAAGVRRWGETTSCTICALERAPWPRKAHTGFGRASAISGGVFEVGLEEQAAGRDGRAPLAEEPCVWRMVRSFGSGRACGKWRRHMEGSVGLAGKWTVSLLKGLGPAPPSPPLG